MVWWGVFEVCFLVKISISKNEFNESELSSGLYYFPYVNKKIMS